MRTTLTIDDDIARKLKKEMQRSGKPFKQVVNDLLRRGLHARRKPETVAPFRVRARPLKLRSGLSYENIENLLDQLEGPARR